jgi:hypothetical protein
MRRQVDGLEAGAGRAEEDPAVRIRRVVRRRAIRCQFELPPFRAGGGVESDEEPVTRSEVEAAVDAEELRRLAVRRCRLPDLRAGLRGVEREHGPRLVGEIESGVGRQRPPDAGLLERRLPSLLAGAPVDAMDDRVVAREVDRVADDRDVVRDAAAGLELPVEDGMPGRPLDPDSHPAGIAAEAGPVATGDGRWTGLRCRRGCCGGRRRLVRWRRRRARRAAGRRPDERGHGERRGQAAASGPTALKPVSSRMHRSTPDRSRHPRPRSREKEPPTARNGSRRPTPSVEGLDRAESRMLRSRGRRSPRAFVPRPARSRPVVPRAEMSGADRLRAGKAPDDSMRCH